MIYFLEAVNNLEYGEEAPEPSLIPHQGSAAFVALGPNWRTTIL